MKRRGALAPLLLSILAAPALGMVACDRPTAGTEPPASGGTSADAGPGTVGAASTAPEPQLIATQQLEARVAQFAPVELDADIEDLPASEKEALEHLIEAARLLDPVFDRQAWVHNPEFTAELAQAEDEASAAALAYVQIMRGPWDRQRHFEPFAVAVPHPPGAGFYPEDLTKAEFKAYLEGHPDERESLEDLLTVVRREGDRLVAVPYAEAYAEWLEPAADELRAAAAATKDPTLAKFLSSRAEAFGTDDYYDSDKDWMDLASRVEITIGPYETYEDELAGLKASYEAFVTISDPAASKDLAKFKERLPAMEKNLPIPDDMKTVRGAESPIRVVDLVFTSGDARKSVQTIAFNLPNDERVRKEKGAKKVMLRNIIKQKFETIMRPIAERIIDEKQLSLLSADAFFNETLFHELSHSLGPAFTERTRDGKTEKVEVRLALGASYSPLEEGKADVMGAYNILYMIDEGEFAKSFRKKLLLSYFAGLFRSVRFGVAEAHGKGAAFQINRYLEEGAATYDDETGRFSVHPKKLEASIKKLVHDVCVMQDAGDPAEVEAFLAKYGVVSEPMQAALDKLDGIPVDLRPYYPLANEQMPASP